MWHLKVFVAEKFGYGLYWVYIFGGYPKQRTLFRGFIGKQEYLEAKNKIRLMGRNNGSRRY